MKVNIELRGSRVYSCSVSPQFSRYDSVESHTLLVHLSELGEMSHEEVLEEVQKYLASRGDLKYHVDIWAVVRAGENMTSKHLTYEVY